MKFINYLLLLAVLLIQAKAAEANDGKNYNASGCVPTSPLEGIYMQGGNIVNYSSTQYLYIDCPVTKEIIHGKIQSAWIEIRNANPYAQASCTLYNRSNREPEKLIFQVKFIYGSSTPQWQKLVFGELKSTPESYYHFACSIPPSFNGVASYLGAYSVTEI